MSVILAETKDGFDSRTRYQNQFLLSSQFQMISRPDERSLRNWISFALIAGTLLVYAGAVKFEFTIYDDNQYVAENATVLRGLTLVGIKEAFTTPLMGNWHPITVLSHMLDCSLFGASPGAHHAVSVIIHCANALILFRLLLTLTSATLRSAVVAALFAWHPLHVESVAWIAERKDVLSAFFGFLCLMTYARFAQCETKNEKLKNYCLALLLFALGLMSKPMLVTWPFVLLLLDYWPLGRLGFQSFSVQDLRRLILEKLPFFALSTGMCMITLATQKQSGSTEAAGQLHVFDRIGNAVISYFRYLRKTIWPDDLAVLYPNPGHWEAWKVAVAIVGLLAFSVLAVMLIRRQPWLAVGWFWYLGTLVPVIGVIQFGTQAMADRYSYIPLVGIFIGCVWLGGEVAK